VLPPLPSSQPPAVRPTLLAEAAAFVGAASRLPGVRRIALVGSIATDKAFPKDVDLLVTVDDEADLDPLGNAGPPADGATPEHRAGSGRRRVPGRSSRPLPGPNVSLKRCGPGIRVSCDAEHCGRRASLHDDLQTVRLPHTTVASPPVEVWPRPILHAAGVAHDVREFLLDGRTTGPEGG
jgi:hypothetical protein